MIWIYIKEMRTITIKEFEGIMPKLDEKTFIADGQD